MKRRNFITSSGVALGASLLKPTESFASSIAVESSPKSNGEGSLESVRISGPKLEDIHKLMEKVCKDNAGNPQVGAFFVVSWLVQNVRRDFSDAEKYIKNLNYPTPFPKINAGLEIDLSLTDISVNNGDIFLKNFSPAIVYREPGKNPRPYNTITIKFAPVRLKLSQDLYQAGKLRFYLTTGDPTSNDYPKFTYSAGTPDATVLKDNQIDPKDYNTAEAAIRVSTAPIDIINSFVASLPILGIVEAMRQFGIGDPMQFYFDGDLVIVHGPSNVSAISPCGPGAGTKVTSAIQSPTLTPPNPTNNSNGFSMTFKHAVDPIDKFGASQYPPFGYFYPLEWSFKDFGIGVVSPGVSASDSGDVALFHWEYHASARPKPNSINVKIAIDPGTHLPELQIRLDCPFDVGGVAGVSMKVGCVTVPLLSTSILGHVDPSEFTLRFALANTGNGPALIVTASYDCSVDISFYGPPMIDVLLNVFMASFGNHLIANGLHNMVSSLNFPLVDLSGLGYLPANQARSWRLGQSFHTNSMLFGLEQGREV